MKNIIHHVHSKPEHIRHLVAIGCTAVVGAVVLGFWFRSFQNTTYALLNPGQASTVNQPAVAANVDSSQSLFAHISSSFADIKAQISSLFAGPSAVQTDNNVQTQQAGPVHPLPVAGDK